MLLTVLGILRDYCTLQIGNITLFSTIEVYGSSLGPKYYQRLFPYETNSFYTLRHCNWPVWDDLELLKTIFPFNLGFLDLLEVTGFYENIFFTAMGIYSCVSPSTSSPSKNLINRWMLIIYVT